MRASGGALSIPIDLNDPDLVLYAPLWYPGCDMVGSSLTTLDKNRETLTVVNSAGVDEKGRTFNGSNQAITLPDTNRITTCGFTLMAWFNYTAVGADYMGIFCNEKDGGMLGGLRGYGLKISTAGELVGHIGYNAESWGEAAYACSSGTWHCGILMNDCSYNYLLIDGVWKATYTHAGNFCDPRASTMYIGRSPLDTYFNGKIGEVLLYDRSIGWSDARNLFEKTKWRYL